GIGGWKDEKRENIDLMQFIGLYDNTKFEELTEKEKKEWLKNNKKEDWKGKEIYEGDIVKDCIGNVGLVKYLYWRAFCGFTIDTGNDPTWYRENGEFNDLRIIGNKFENPELSKKGLK
ncbi:MAG: YopX family protein, partial [Candidatus Thorarchaeota archaeon]